MGQGGEHTFVVGLLLERSLQFAHRQLRHVAGHVLLGEAQQVLHAVRGITFDEVLELVADQQAIVINHGDLQPQTFDLHGLVDSFAGRWVYADTAHQCIGIVHAVDTAGPPHAANH